MEPPAAGAPQTQHTTSPVPLVLVGERWRGASLRNGILADVAPTVCELMAVRPGGVIEVRGLDAIDGTPVLDIKPILGRTHQR